MLFRSLGRLAPVHISGLPMMAEVTSTYHLPEPPPAVAWYKGLFRTWGMGGNDRFGDCVFAGAAHFEMLVSKLAGRPIDPTTEQILHEYALATGFDPRDPSTDNGAVESQILRRWKEVGMFGRTIDGFIGINPESQTQLKDAVWLFGASLLGIELPVSAQSQQVWDVPLGGPKGDGAPNSWGPHCTLLVGAGRRGVTMITWGQEKQATWEFMRTYCEEAYAILSPDWIIEKTQSSPGGVPLASLHRDLRAIRMA